MSNTITLWGFTQYTNINQGYIYIPKKMCCLKQKEKFEIDFKTIVASLIDLHTNVLSGDKSSIIDSCFHTNQQIIKLNYETKHS